MSSKLNAGSFIAVVRKSGLLDEARLTKLLEDYQSAGGDTAQVAQLAEHLIEKQALTRWQAEKLLQGKHKGYFLGKYRLLQLLGKGGMSAVYLAEHTVMRRRCAVKVLPTKRVTDSSYLGRFHREAQAVAALDDPNIVRAYDVDHQVDNENEIHFLVMEYVDGPSLQEYVAQQGPLPFDDAAEFVRQASLGLAHAHKVGMVHRDVKPGNLLLAPNRVVKVLDLGLARFFDDTNPQALTIQHDEKVLGTADYLAPEQALDSHTVDARADIYSLGCTLYFLLCGHPPFTEGTLTQRLMAHQTKEPPAIETFRPDCPPELAAILRKMMAKKADDRYATAGDLAQTLAAFLQSRLENASTAAQPSPPQPSTPLPIARPVARPVAKPIAKVVPAPEIPATPSIAEAELPQISVDSTGSLSGLSPAANSPKSSSDSRIGSSSSTKFVKPDFSFMSTARDADDGSTIEIPVFPSSPDEVSFSPTDAEPLAPPEALLPVSEDQPERAEEAPADSETPDFNWAPQESAQAVDDFALNIGPVDSSSSGAFPRSSTVRSGAARKTSQSNSQFSLPWMAAGAAGGLFILMGLTWALGFLGGDSPAPSQKKPTKDVADHASAAPEGSAATATPKPAATLRADWSRKRKALVGPTGDFRTIQAALDTIRKEYQPLSRRDFFRITVSGGEYAERIVLTEKDPEGLILTGELGAILKPSGDGPIIRMTGASRCTIEGFQLAAEGKPVAIELTEGMLGSRLNNLQIHGFGETGILAKGATGSFGDMQGIIENCRLEKTSASAAGVRLQSNGSTDSGYLIIKNCQFIGPMAQGVQMEGKEPIGIQVTHSIFDGVDQGVFINGPQLRDFAVSQNTFHKTRQGIVLAKGPATGSRGLNFRRNLFVGVQEEVLIESGFKVEELGPALALGGDSLGLNFSDRQLPTTPAPTAVHTLFEPGTGSRSGLKTEFQSTDPSNPRYMAPTPDTPAANAPGRLSEEPAWIGAKSP